MDVVKSFNTELSSLYDVKPPISKAKMTSITKGAIKGIKFYKHIVQSVEKFIQKCRPEYKVPGLYVVDSIVRQSRHQFGADKDVFGPRFLKNINVTFQQLFKCAEDDRPKIIRVLNLWQKNAVFPIDVIQPLMDMGNPNTSTDWPLDAPVESVKESPPKPAANEDSRSSSRRKEIDPALWKSWPQGNEESAASDNRTYAEMSTKNLEKFTKAEMTNAIENEVSSSSMFRTKIKQENLQEDNTVKFNKKLLDFDYGDEEDEEEVKNEDGHLSNQPNALALSMAQNLLSNPELLRQLQQMQHTIQQNEQAFNTEMGFSQQQPIKQEEGNYVPEARSTPPTQQPPLPPVYQQQLTTDNDKDDRVLPQPPLPAQDLDERSLSAIMATHIPLPEVQLTNNHTDKDDRVIPKPVQDLDERSLAAICRGVPPPMQYPDGTYPPYQQPGIYPQQPPLPLMDTSYQPVLPSGGRDEDERLMYSMPGEPPLPPQDFDERQQMAPLEEPRSRKDRSRSRSGSRSRGRSSRHRSRSRSPRRKRSRSRSPRKSGGSSQRSKERERIREKEKERDKERERKRKGLPPIRKNCVSVCTTTLWIGHVPKSCTEMEITSAFGTYGQILSIYMIPPRGCAYVVMDRRQDAYKALTKLRNAKILQSNSVKMAWAPGKGVKGKEFKDFWEVEAGVSYVPYEKIPENAATLDQLEEGGFIDEESLPDNLKALRQKPEDMANLQVNSMAEAQAHGGPMPPMVPPPVIPPSTTVNLPMLIPHPMQQQFGLHLSGLLPPQAMMMQVPMGIPPPNPMLLVQPQSQNLLGNMVSPLVPRTVTNIATALQNLKNIQLPPDPAAGSPMVPATNAGDATPTDEEGTSISSPAIQKNNSVTTPQQPNQFNHMMNLSRPPPVTSSGTPIPYPPPSGYNFPPPGMRQQFPWMQKEHDSSQRAFNRPPLPPQSPMKDGTDRRPVDMDRSTSPDKMSQEMVISTDDESSMDHEYHPNDGPPPGPRFPHQGSPEFPRMPMGMHRMRGPGPRFPPMGQPFHPRMGGPPRPMGMHPGHEFGPRGLRMQGGPPPPHRDGRDWYSRDFEGPPPFERERSFRDDGWTTAESLENDQRQNMDGDRRDDRNRDGRDRSNTYGRDRPRMDDDFNVRHRPRPPPKGKSEADLKNDLSRLQFYRRDKKPDTPNQFQKQPVKSQERPPNNDPAASRNKQGPEKMETPEEKAKREREARKRSRWGRTLSEEREFQEQRKCEIEMKRTEIERKFQKIEQSAQLVPSNPGESPGLAPETAPSNANDAPKTEAENLPVPPAVVSDPGVQPVAQNEGSSIVPDLPMTNDPEEMKSSATVDISMESSISIGAKPISIVSEPISVGAEMISEPASTNTFVPTPLSENVSISESISEPVQKSEVLLDESSITNSLPPSNNNHVEETTSNVEITCKSVLADDVPKHDLPTTTDTQIETKDDDVNVLQTSAAEEPVPASDS